MEALKDLEISLLWSPESEETNIFHDFTKRTKVKIIYSFEREDKKKLFILISEYDSKKEWIQVKEYKNFEEIRQYIQERFIY